jgi:hypothetical protein
MAVAYAKACYKRARRASTLVCLSCLFTILHILYGTGLSFSLAYSCAAAAYRVRGVGHCLK